MTKQEQANAGGAASGDKKPEGAKEDDKKDKGGAPLSE
jgi:hypothetical protein